MRPLASTWLSAEVSVEERVFEVPPPTVKEALTILAAEEALGHGQEDCFALLRRACATWLPDELRSLLLPEDIEATPAGVIASINQVNALLALCVEKEADAEEDGSDLDKAKAEARRTSWRRMVAQYRHFYPGSGTYEEVLREPFGFFLAMLVESRVLRAREQIEEAEWYSAVKTGEMKLLIERADLPKSKSKPYHREVMTQEEQRAWLEKMSRERGQA